MAFTATLYTFAKRKNSTAIPSGGTDTTCTANAELDHLRPELKFNFTGGVGNNPTAYNYCRIPAFGRYYYIDKWSCVDGVWVASLSVDAMASWRQQIKNSNKYILRAHKLASGADVTNNLYLDNRYPSRAEPVVNDYIKTSPWEGLSDGTKITFVIGIIGKGSTKYYSATVAELEHFLDVILADDFYTRFLNVLGLDTLYPEAKIAVNPLQYISTIRLYPFQFGGDWPPTSIPYGPIVLTGPTGADTIHLHPLPSLVTINGTLTWKRSPLELNIQHPDADTRGLWLNASPWSSYHIFFPPWGIVPLDAGIVHACGTISANYRLDIKTGSATLDIIGFSSGSSGYHHLGRLIAQLGVDFPVANIQTPGYGLASFMATALGAASSIHGGADPYLATAGGIASAVGDAIAGQVPRVSMISNVGSSAELNGNPTFQACYYRPAPEDIAENGRPVMQYAQVSSYQGYMEVSDGDISAAATPDELSTIAGYLTGGFFNE